MTALHWIDECKMNSHEFLGQNFMIEPFAYRNPGFFSHPKAIPGIMIHPFHGIFQGIHIAYGDDKPVFPSSTISGHPPSIRSYRGNTAGKRLHNCSRNRFCIRWEKETVSCIQPHPDFFGFFLAGKCAIGRMIRHASRPDKDKKEIRTDPRYRIISLIPFHA